MGTIITISIIFILIMLIILLPVGFYFNKHGKAVELKLKAGFISVGILPKTENASDESKKKNKPKKKKAEHKDDKTEAKKNKVPGFVPKISFGDIKHFLRILRKLLGRLWRAFKIDRLNLSVHIGGADEPFDAVNNYSRLNAALGALLPLIHEIIKVKEESIDTYIDFEENKTDVDVEAAAHFLLGKLLHLAFAAVFSLLVWFVKRKIKDRKLQKSSNNVASSEE